MLLNITVITPLYRVLYIRTFIDPVKMYSIFYSFFIFLKNFIYFLYSRFLLVIHFIRISVYMSIPISQFIPPPPPPHHFLPLVSIRLFSTSVSLISVLQTGSSVPFFQVPHICVKIRYSKQLKFYSSKSQAVSRCLPLAPKHFLSTEALSRSHRQ